MTTNFPKQGDDKKISLRNSQHPQFDFQYAKNLKENYPEIWKAGGNIRGNEAFNLWGKARDGSETDAVLDWIKEREAWAARHKRNFRLAGVIANVKWGTIVEKGEKYMKDLINQEKQDQKKIVVPFEIKAENFTDDEEYFYIKGYGSTFGNVDLGRDVILRGAFSKTIREGKTVKMLWQHDASMPVGVWLSIVEDEKGLYMEGRLPKGDNFVAGRIMPQLKNGSLDGLSIGFRIDDFEYIDGIRHIKEADLMEVSIVTFPMNQSATITGMKRAVPYQDLPMADEERSWDSRSAVNRVREFTNSEDGPSRQYRQAFLWFDAENADNFAAYKLPIADVIDGELVAVPRAIFAAAAALNGARGGVDIPDSDKASVERSIERYYDKLGREAPFAKAYNLDQVLDIKTKRDFERCLRDSGLFSRKAALHLASNWQGEEPRDSVKKESVSFDQVQSELSELLNLIKSKKD